jgi:MoaA/NifB/PqqE/SkfB family radical SAM enzyme
VLAISIDGTPFEHDAIRCHPGAFHRTVANLDMMHALHVPFGFVFTLTQHNVDSLEFVVRLAAEHGARSVQVHPLTKHGRAVTEMSDANPDSIELIVALFEASRLGRELGVLVHVDVLTAQQIANYRDYLVPRRPVDNLSDVAPVLIVDADSSVVPLTHEVNRSVRLGVLTDARLRSLASDWIAAGQADRLASACERTWEEVTNSCGDVPVYWYGEVAARTFEVTYGYGDFVDPKQRLAIDSMDNPR